MTMLYPQEDGTLVEIPDEHAAVLALYRDRMPVVFEVQEWGPPMLYPLIDVDAEPYGTPQPGALERAAAGVARDLKRRRVDSEPCTPDYERLAYAAIRACITDMAELAAAVAHEDGPEAVERAAKDEAARMGRHLTKAVERAVRSAVTETLKGVAA